MVLRGFFKATEGRTVLAVALLWMFTCFAVLLCSCSVAQSDAGFIVTENGIVAAEAEYHEAYLGKLEQCQGEAEPKTPAAEECFGEWAKTDQLVNDILAAAVSTLRAYWIARAEGETPDFARTMADVGLLLESLPPIARPYFDRVRGVSP